MSVSTEEYWTHPYQYSALYQVTAIAPRVLLAAAAGATIICLIIFACTPGAASAGTLALHSQCLFLAKWIGFGACGVLAVAMIRDFAASVYAGIRCENSTVFCARVCFEWLHTLSSAVSFGLLNLAIHRLTQKD